MRPDPDHGAARRQMVAEWLHLTRDLLPAMARTRPWPISQDHCFMRVCLDAAYGGRWDAAIPRPAIRHADNEHLAAAIAVAQSLLRDPNRLPALNAASLRARARHP